MVSIITESQFLIDDLSLDQECPSLQENNWSHGIRSTIVHNLKKGIFRNGKLIKKSILCWPHETFICAYLFKEKGYYCIVECNTGTCSGCIKEETVNEFFHKAIQKAYVTSDGKDAAEYYRRQKAKLIADGGWEKYERYVSPVSSV
jgi:hypothetical protein